MSESENGTESLDTFGADADRLVVERRRQVNEALSELVEEGGGISYVYARDIRKAANVGPEMTPQAIGNALAWHEELAPVRGLTVSRFRDSRGNPTLWTVREVDQS